MARPRLKKSTNSHGEPTPPRSGSDSHEGNRPFALPRHLVDFLAANSAFTLEEFLEADEESGRKRSGTVKLLKRYVALGYVTSARRGLYWVSNERLDHFLVAMKLAEDVVLAYEGAAGFHELLTLQYQLHFLTAHQMRHFALDEVIFQPVRAANPRSEQHVQKVERNGHLFYVTTRERTLVDLLDRFDSTTDLSRLWYGFRTAGPLDSRAMLSYSKRLDRSLTYARLGLFLANLPGHGQVARQLEWLVSSTRQYLQRRRRSRWNGDEKPKDEGPIEFVPRFNLFVPREFLLDLERRNL